MLSRSIGRKDLLRVLLNRVLWTYFFSSSDPKEEPELNLPQNKSQASSSPVNQETVSRHTESNEYMTADQPAFTAPSENQQELNTRLDISQIVHTENISLQIEATEDT